MAKILKTPLSLSAVDTTDWSLIEAGQVHYNVAVSVVLSAGASLTYTVEGTLEELTGPDDSSAQGVPLENMQNLTSTVIKQITGPLTGVRLNVSSHTSGTATLYVRQAGLRVVYGEEG